MTSSWTVIVPLVRLRHFFTLFHHLFVTPPLLDGGGWGVRGRGLSLIIINVTLIVINIVFDASLGHKEIFWLRLDHIHGKPCHR